LIVAILKGPRYGSSARARLKAVAGRRAIGARCCSRARCGSLLKFNLFRGNAKTLLRRTFCIETSELVERDPFFRGMWNRIRHPHGQAQQQQSDPSVDASAREFDDEMELEAREPEADYDELMQRYFDDLYERQLAAEAEAELAARDFEDEEFELVQRAPSPNIGDFFNKLFHIKPKQAEKKKDTSASDSDVDAREFEEFDELD
jgi:hypothetical protein